MTGALARRGIVERDAGCALVCLLRLGDGMVRHAPGVLAMLVLLPMVHSADGPDARRGGQQMEQGDEHREQGRNHRRPQPDSDQRMLPFRAHHGPTI